MHVAVVGTGYVGLVAGACLAETGNSVVCVDIDADKVERLRQGIIPIYEPGLEEVVVRNATAGRLLFTTDLTEAVQASEVVFIAVGTPQDEDGSADLTHVLNVAHGIGEALNGYKIIVDKSTVPVGTAERVRSVINALTEHPFAVVSNPEFLKEGSAVDDFLRPDRVVIGTDDPRAEAVMLKLYEPFVRTGKPILVMDQKSAELTKYASNAMLASRISFMNEIANYCDQVGADVRQVRRGMATDSRIGPAFLFAGIGYGGSCFPKDVKALLRMGQDAGTTFQVVEATERANEFQKRLLVPRVAAFLGGLAGKQVAVWGLAFKPRTDDMREAPAIAVIEGLLAGGATVHAYDPEASEQARRYFGNRIELYDSAYHAVVMADALVVVTEWNEFREPDWDRIKEAMDTPAVFDGRNIYDPEELRARGFYYEGVGVR
jgi:UDPglucose 6-dehydrogenase